MTGLTRQQWKLLGFIESYVAQHGFSPTYVEMSVHLGMASKSGIHRLIVGLEKRGRISRLPNLPRSVLPLPPRSSEIAREISREIPVRTRTA